MRGMNTCGVRDKWVAIKAVKVFFGKLVALAKKNFGNQTKLLSAK